MRLINARTGWLREFNQDDPPPYAILSHTWGAKHNEVTFQDVEKYQKISKEYPLSPYSTVVSSKFGYKKLKGCCRQALRDGINWVWADTCCIDKASSTELSEAINSMFKWYRQSVVCYVHLSDVSDHQEDFSKAGSAFRSSRWFTRGWTLQELLAPRKVQFYTGDWNYIGQMSEGSRLVEVVSEVTSIPPGFLEGQNLLLANVAQKMSWAVQRSTTRKEDMAYCLLGLFDVNMPLLYGEGGRAFRRLQEEIMKNTFDHTLLAWGILPWHEGYSEDEERDYALLADSPADFSNCGSLVRCRPRIWEHHETAYQMTNRGLQIELPLRQTSSGKWLAKLSCSHWKHVDVRLSIILRKKGNRFIRTSRMLVVEDDSLDEAVTKYKIRNMVLNDQTEKFRLLESIITVDLPRNYRWEIKYLDPDFTLKQDRFRLSPNSLRISYPQDLQLADTFKMKKRPSSFSGGLVRSVMGSPPAQPPSPADFTRFQLQLSEDADQGPRSVLLCVSYTPHHGFGFNLAPMPETMPQEWPMPTAEAWVDSLGPQSLRVGGTIIKMRVLREWEFGEDILVKIDEDTETIDLSIMLSKALGPIVDDGWFSNRIVTDIRFFLTAAFLAMLIMLGSFRFSWH